LEALSETVKESSPREVLAKVEAALYASGRPLTVEEISRVAGTASERKATAIAREVARTINSNLQAIEVVEYNGPKFAMQLKAQFTQTARKFATRPLLTRAALRTLSYIAFLQPISSSELAQRRGSAVYEHLRELEDVGFVAAERRGRGRAYHTTTRFAEYFGLSTDLPTLKRQLESRTLTLR
jgi:segregation and condensation protein B